MSTRRAGQREIIPLFPLGTVMVPGLLLPLHIFEPRYRQLLADLELLPEADRFFGVIAIREGHEVGDGGVRSMFDVGTTAVLRQVRRTPDGGANIMTTGELRFRLLRLVDGDTPYACAEVEWLEESEGEHAARLAPAVGKRFDDYRAALAHAGAVEAAQMAVMPEDPRVLSYLVAAAMVLDLADRQQLLEAPDVSTRLRSELALLHRENALLRALPSLPAIELAGTGICPN